MCDASFIDEFVLRIYRENKTSSLFKYRIRCNLIVYAILFLLVMLNWATDWLIKKGISLAPVPDFFIQTVLPLLLIAPMVGNIFFSFFIFRPIYKQTKRALKQIRTIDATVPCRSKIAFPDLKDNFNEHVYESIPLPNAVPPSTKSKDPPINQDKVSNSKGNETVEGTSYPWTNQPVLKAISRVFKKDRAALNGPPKEEMSTEKSVEAEIMLRRTRERMEELRLMNLQALKSIRLKTSKRSNQNGSCDSKNITAGEDKPEDADYRSRSDCVFNDGQQVTKQDKAARVKSDSTDDQPDLITLDENSLEVENILEAAGKNQFVLLTKIPPSSVTTQTLNQDSISNYNGLDVAKGS